MEEPTFLAKLNQHERDKRIVFYEGPHIYEIDGKQGYTSVTTWNHSHFPEFNQTKIIDNILKSRRYNDPSYKYYSMTREDIENMWEKNRVEASTAGTQTHYNIECYYNNIDVSDNSIEFKYFKNFVEDNKHLKAYRTEWCVFHEELKLSGSIDMLFIDNNTGEFLIYDWKRSKGIEYENNYGKSALTPCIKHLPDTNYWHYALQLNVYRRILLEKYDINVKKMALVVLHPDHSYKNYEVIDVNIMEKELNDLWDVRKTQIENIT
jgi:ATP-dependent exoDNAse (exonuclease V) beta subunit